uniref:Uncharacterized protein n=1 Tax=Phlebotomus papatasi TaxID=29031 RepID=A0A1B0DQY4_PHLPP
MTHECCAHKKCIYSDFISICS